MGRLEGGEGRARVITRRWSFALVAVVLALTVAGPAQAVNDTTQVSILPGALTFTTAPNVPNLPTLTLDGSTQTATAQMNSFSVTDATGSAAGWNVTVEGDTGSGKSAVFKQYCTALVTCANGDAAGYKSSGALTLSANSLVLSSSGAGFTGTGTAPTHQCGSGCNVDTASPVKLVSAAANAGMGLWLTTSWGASSLTLTAPPTAKSLPSDEVYRVDLVFSLNSGP
jgi:hypothetical protein